MRSGESLQGHANQVDRLVVQAVGHVEIGLGQRIRLIEIERGFRADGLIVTHHWPWRFRLRPRNRALLDDKGLVLVLEARRPLEFGGLFARREGPQTHRFGRNRRRLGQVESLQRDADVLIAAAPEVPEAEDADQ